MYHKSSQIILFISLILVSIQLKSQVVTGFQAGINMAALGGHKEYYENKFRFGLSAYAFADVGLGRNSIVSIETGLAISQQGMNHIEIIDDLSFRNTKTINNQLDYIYIPLYIKENFNNFYTKIGPYGAYLIHAKSKWRNEQSQAFTVINVTEGFDEQFVGKLNPFDVGLSLGCGYIHFFQPGRKRYRNLGRKRSSPVLTIDARYNIGFLTIDATGDNPDMKLRNRIFTLGLTLTSVRN
jgi:hypothetical protein